MKTKILVFVLFALLISGCRTTKTAAKADIKTNDKVNVNVKATDSGARETKSVKQVNDNGTVSETTEEITSVVNYSKPDSSGKQFPISKAVTRKTAKKQTVNNKQTQIKNNDNIQNDLTIDQKIDAIMGTRSVVKEKTKTETKAPAWMSVGMIIGVAGLLLLAFLVLKRSKLL